MLTFTVVRYQFWQGDLFYFEFRDYRHPKYGGGPIDIHFFFFHLRVWVCPPINPVASRGLISDMAFYFPHLSSSQVLQILTDVLISGDEPRDEISEGVLRSYFGHLSALEPIR